MNFRVKKIQWANRLILIHTEGVLHCKLRCNFLPRVLHHQSKNKSHAMGSPVPVLGMKLKRGLGILVDYQDKPMFSHIIQKVSVRAFH